MALLPEMQTSLDEKRKAALGSATAGQQQFLTPEQSSLITQTQEAALQPLRQGFEQRLGTTIGEMSKRGIAFGGLGEERLQRFLGDEASKEANVAQQIGTNLGANALNQAFQANTLAEQRQLEKNLTAINLAQQGVISGPEIQNILANTFGPGTTLTTQDEQDLQRAATASGLSTEDYQRMKAAIGQGQLKDILQNPEDYIDSPQKAREFQMQMAQMLTDAQMRAAQMQANGQRDASIFGTIGQLYASSNSGGGDMKFGSTIGGAVGSIFGPIGTAAGSFLGNLLPF